MSKDVKDMKECPQAHLGGYALQADEPPVQMQEGRVCVFKEEPGGRCGWRSEEL